MNVVLVQHAPPPPLPFGQGDVWHRVDLSFSVQPVLNFGRRIAAEIDTGSSIIAPKRFWTPCWIALTSGRHILVDASCLLSFDCNSKITGRSQPKCVLVSDWRMFKAFTTGLLTQQNSVRKAISAWVNLWKVNNTTSFFGLCNKIYCFISSVFYSLWIMTNYTFQMLRKTHTFTLNSSQTCLMASSPCSCMIRMILSTAMYVEFHRVLMGQMSWRLHLSFTTSAAMCERPDLFHMAWHFPKAARDKLLQVWFFCSAMSASVVATKFNKWHAHLWCEGSWYSRPLPSSRMLNVSWYSPSNSSWQSWSVSDSASSEWLCSPKILKAWTKFEPLSVVVLTTFPLIL